MDKLFPPSPRQTRPLSGSFSPLHVDGREIRGEAASVAGVRSVSCLSTLSNPLCARGSREAAALSLQWLEGGKKKKKEISTCASNSGVVGFGKTLRRWSGWSGTRGSMHFAPKKFFLFSVSIFLKFFTKRSGLVRDGQKQYFGRPSRGQRSAAVSFINKQLL